MDPRVKPEDDDTPSLLRRQESSSPFMGMNPQVKSVDERNFVTATL